MSAAGVFERRAGAADKLKLAIDILLIPCGSLMSVRLVRAPSA